MLLSPALLLTLAIATLLIGVRTLAMAWQQYGLRRQCESHLLHVSSQQAEFLLITDNQAQLLEAQEKLEDTIDIATNTVRTIHKGIAAIPFGILEAIPATRHTTKVVRGTHDLISDVVYSSISIVNKTTGKVIRKGLRKANNKCIEKDDNKAIGEDDK
jgi:hypothetical protein